MKSLGGANSVLIQICICFSVDEILIRWGSIIKNDYVKRWRVAALIPYLPPFSDPTEHDLAVIVLQTEAHMSDGIELIHYPTKAPTPGRFTTITIYGHGLIRYGNKYRSHTDTTVLQQTQMLLAYAHEDRYFFVAKILKLGAILQLTTAFD